VTRVDDGSSETDYWRDGREVIIYVKHSRDNTAIFVRDRYVV